MQNRTTDSLTFVMSKMNLLGMEEKFSWVCVDRIDNSMRLRMANSVSLLIYFQLECYRSCIRHGVSLLIVVDVDAVVVDVVRKKSRGQGRIQMGGDKKG